MTTPSDDHTLRLRDAARRLELNFHEFSGARPRLIMGKMRGLPVMRQALYENYLSSLYAAEEVVLSLCDKYKWKNFKQRIQDAAEVDEVVKYAHYSRNSQDHGISPVATRPAIDPSQAPPMIMSFGPFGSLMQLPPGQIQRDEFQLSPIVLRDRRGKMKTIPVPTKHMGVELYNVTPELVAQLSSNWWFAVINSIVFKHFGFPRASGGAAPNVP